LEEHLQALREAGDLRAVATATIEAYGPEVLGFLVTLLRDEYEAQEAFAQACEDLWAGLDRFEGRSSLRTWFYVLARHAAARLRRAPDRRVERRVALSEIADLAASVRAATLQHLRTDVKDGVAAIRAALSEEDRALLVLRVDREMSWNEIACIVEVEATSEEALIRSAARLRKRFQLVKEEIRTRAREAGLFVDESR
jgi:RNA polymerase sigma-70 factor (ECF subfamily)